MLAGTTPGGSRAGSNTPATIAVWQQNGIVNPYCSQTITQSQATPARTSFPVEQLRFNSHYWDRVTFNGRYLYSGGTTTIHNFSETFTGFSRGNVRQTIETGSGPNGQLADNKRVNNNGDFAAEAVLTRFLSVSDVFYYWNMRTEGYSNYTTQTWTGTSGSIKPPIPATSVLTPLNDPTITYSAPNTIFTGFLTQKYIGNTILGTATVTPTFNFTAGWRFNDRNITDPGDDLTWHQNWGLFGAVVQPTRKFRLNANYEFMRSHNANSQTPTNSFTREMPNSLGNFRVRATVIPAKWINFGISGNDYEAKNDDPLVNHKEHNRGVSFATQILPAENLSLDLAYAYDTVYSVTDLCYAFTPNPNAPLPAGAANAGTCTVANGGSASLYLGNGYYDAPSNYFSGTVNYAPTRNVRLMGGARFNNLGGHAEQLNPLMVPGALSSQLVNPFADVLVNIARGWAWHGNWVHQSYDESGGPGPAAREFHGELITLGVKYAF
jgi:hypothetical protein